MAAYSLQVIVRMQQYKDDLLSSCLQMVLTLPEEMVLLELDSLIPAIEVEYTYVLLHVYVLFILLHVYVLFMYMYYYMYKYCNY